MSKTLAAAVHAIDSQLALGDVRTLDQVKDEQLAGDRFTMYLFAAFALIALVLAAIGIYGLMAFAVSQRTQEIGLRMALGASRGHVLLLIFREASLLASGGLSIGFVGAIFLGRTMQSSLYGVGAIDLTAILTVTATLFGTAILASVLPARRAASIEPIVALRAG